VGVCVCICMCVLVCVCVSVVNRIPACNLNNILNINYCTIGCVVTFGDYFERINLGIQFLLAQ